MNKSVVEQDLLVAVMLVEDACSHHAYPNENQSRHTCELIYEPLYLGFEVQTSLTHWFFA